MNWKRDYLEIIMTVLLLIVFICAFYKVTLLSHQLLVVALFVSNISNWMRRRKYN